MVAAVLGFGAVAFFSQFGGAPVKQAGGAWVWNSERGVPAVSDANAARIAELPPGLLTHARW